MDPVYACLTTLPERIKALEETVASLLPQVDRLYIFLHGYNPTDLPAFLEDPKIQLAYDIEWGDKGDGDKFHWAKDLQGYVLICDDDLIYPPDYAKVMIESIERYQRKAIITFHGIVMLPLPIASYYDDRYVYPCLGDVASEKPVQFGGTCVVGFHSDIGYDLSFEEKPVNMSDVHFGIWALEKGIPMYVVPHKAGWIRHSANVELAKTIYSQKRWNTFDEVMIINSRPHLFRTKFKARKKPKVSIIVINSRLRTHPHFVKECYDSLRRQTYTNKQIIVMDNMDRMMTIGKAYNEGVRIAKGKYVLFVGDDDFITDDYVTTLVSMIETSRDPKVVGITSYLTMFHNLKQTGEPVSEVRELIPTGMYLRSYLKKNPFKEYLTRFVDSELMERTKEQGLQLLVARYSYGYHYRSHPEQVSGHKQLGGNHSAASSAKEKISQRLKEIENVS